MCRFLQYLREKMSLSKVVFNAPEVETELWVEFFLLYLLFYKVKKFVDSDVGLERFMIDALA